MRETRGRSIDVPPTRVRPDPPCRPGLPVDPFRAGALLAGRAVRHRLSYAASTDARAPTRWSRGYPWGRTCSPRRSTTTRSTARSTDVDPQPALVGVMGGHALQRGDPAYADAARFGHAVGGRLVVATGGGPGRHGGGQPRRLPVGAARTQPPRGAGAARARAVVPALGRRLGRRRPRRARATWPDGAESLGIPTWHYGHEPANLFATAIAKYFRNALREAILLQICSAGIVFLPGAAGTVQEIFQDACENYYADESVGRTDGAGGVEYWTETLPAWPLLRRWPGAGVMEPHLHLVDSVESAANLLDSGT